MAVTNKITPKFNENGELINKENFYRGVEEIGKRRFTNFNIKQPRTIQEKLSYLMIHDCSNLRTQCADKLRVREYVTEKLGKDICVPLIAAYNNTSEIKWDELPNEFVIKCNHGSGMNVVVTNKSTANKGEIIAKLNKWMAQDFSQRNNYEMHYHNIKHNIVVEKRLHDERQTSSLFDYKFWCFNGEIKMYTINTGFGHGDILYYDMNDNPIDLYMVLKKKPNIKFEKPKCFKQMIEYATKLAEDFRFVRVDFYEVNGEIYLGELTFTPGACIFNYTKPGGNRMIGDMLKLDEIVYTVQKPVEKPRKNPIKLTMQKHVRRISSIF